MLLFEDEFGDKGYTRANVRYRVMADCFFVLLRSFVRVDGVLVRILDTRVFHAFGSNKILRDFSWLEATHDELTEQGYSFMGQHMLVGSQSDLVYSKLGKKRQFFD